jgi:hypothetical protein
MDEGLKKYRQELIESKNASQDELDKALLTLSAGAFGITFAFINDFITGTPVWISLLFASWISWGLTIGFCLVAFYLSVISFDRSLNKLSKDPESIYEESINNWIDTTIRVLNIVSLVGFLFGLLIIGIFVYLNF